MGKELSKNMRLVHRYLGFFLAGIMTVYALSGIVLIFRTTDAFKNESQVEKKLEPNITAEDLGKTLKMRNFKVEKEEVDIVYFENGTYNKTNGMASYTSKKYPFFLDKMTKLHKATTNSPLFWLNIFFGISLLFFVLSSFWMFSAKSSIFRTGLYFTLGGVVLTLVLLFI